MILQIPIFSVLLVLSHWSVCWTSVIQPPMMETISGANVILPCNHTSITSGDYIYWYKNIPDQGLQSLIRGFKDTASDSRTLTFSKDRKSSELHIQNIRPEESGMYLCALQDRNVATKLTFGKGTQLNVKPNIKDTEPSVYRLKADKNVEGVPKSVCLATDFPVLKNETELKLNTEKVNKDERLWLDKTEDNTWRYSTVILNSDCRVEYDDKTILEKPSAGKIECSSPQIDETFKTDEKLNTLSLRMFGLRFFTIKGIVFNILITLRLWSA